MFGFYNNEKPGVGINKNAPKKKPFFRFFELYFRKFWKLIGLNLLYTLFCLPIVTIGPATAAMTKVLKNYIIEKPTFMTHEFIDTFKKNFKSSFFIGIIDVIVIASAIAGCFIYPQFGRETGSMLWYAFLATTVILGLTFIIMNFYIYIMIVSTNISLKDTIKNSLALTFMALKKNLITLVVVLAIVAVMAYLTIINPVTIMLFPFMPVASLGLVICFNSYPIVRKYVIDPYYEQKGERNPEYDYFNISDDKNNEVQKSDDEDVIFTDTGEKEEPVHPQKSRTKKRGRTIS